MAELETVKVAQEDGVAWVTLARPEVRNAINQKMQDELRELWRSFRYDDDVRCIVLAAEGESFCTGIDRGEAISEENNEAMAKGKYPGYPTPWMYDDPGRDVGPKACDLWKPVIAAVQGIACGGAFYMLGETEFIIASDDATFFDPHVTYGMTASFEPMQMLSKMPFGEVMRMSLMGVHERLSASRAHEIGLVSEVVPRDELRSAVPREPQALGDAGDGRCDTERERCLTRRRRRETVDPTRDGNIAAARCERQTLVEALLRAACRPNGCSREPKQRPRRRRTQREQHDERKRHQRRCTRNRSKRRQHSCR